MDKKQFEDILCSLDIDVTKNKVICVEDIDKVGRLFSSLKKMDVKLGVDFYDGDCSGIVEINKKDSNHLSFMTFDNMIKYIIKFHRMILLNIDRDNASPVFLFEAYDDYIDDKDINKEAIYGIYFVEENRLTYKEDEVDAFLSNLFFEENSEVYSQVELQKHYRVTKYLKKGRLAFVNIQGMDLYNSYTKYLGLFEKDDERE